MLYLKSSGWVLILIKVSLMKITEKIGDYWENKEWTMKAPGKKIAIDRDI